MAETNVTQNDRLVLAADMFAAALQRTTSRVDALAKSVGIVVQAIKGVRRQGNDAATVPGGTGGKGGKDEETNDKLKDWAKSVGAALESAFNRGKSALFSFVEAADPSAMSTFHASVTMLQQAIGEGLAPYVDAASRQIQQWAKAFRNLDSDTKNNIIRVSLLVGSLGGVVGVGRALIPVLLSAASAVRVLGAAVFTTPLGQVVGLTTALAGLVLAWRQVAGAATDAGSAMGDASKQQIGAGGNPTEQRRDFSSREIEQLPEPYRAKLLSSVRREIKARQMERPADRDAELRVIERDRAALLRQLEQDIPAALSMLPPDVSEKLKAPGATSAEREKAIVEFVGTLQKQIDEQRATLLPALLEQQKRADTVETVVREELATIMKDYSNRMLRYRARVPRGEIEPGDLDRAREFAGMKVAGSDSVLQGLRSRTLDAVSDRLTKMGIAISPSDRADILQPTDDIGAPFKAAKPKAEAPRQRVDVETARIESQIQVIQRVLGEALKLPSLSAMAASGGGDGFLQNLKSPVQSRFTDPFQYAESVQTAVLNQGDADAKILADRMAFLAQKLGDAVGMVEKFMQSQQRQSASSWLGGVVTITDR